MPLTFHCFNSNCKKPLQVDESTAGTQTDCPHCGHSQTVPLPLTERLDAAEMGGTIVESPADHLEEAIIVGSPATDVDDEATIIRSELSMAEAGETFIPTSNTHANSVVEISEGADGFEELSSYLNEKRGKAAPFQTEKTLAEGGMGAVLVCQDQALGRRVAVKVIKPKIASSPEHRARFLGEAQITGQLEHPNIVPIHDLGKNSDGDLYFSMKLVEGHSLGEIIKAMKGERIETRSLTELLNIFLKVCDGMAFAHAKGVIHRDLKPDNVMVGDFGEVLVMDWGLAKPIGMSAAGEASDDQGPETVMVHEESVNIDSITATAGLAQTMAGTIQGTPAYMPPEQAKGDIERIDHRADIYSLGAILYEILTLERPITGSNITVLVQNACEGNVVPPDVRAPERNIPKELTAVVMKAMAKEQDDRYQHVQNLSRDITLFLEGRAVSAKEDSLLESVVKLVRRNKALSGAISAAAAIILVLATFSYVRIAGERNQALKNEQLARKNEQRAVVGEEAARQNEKRAVLNEKKAQEARNEAVAAQQEQRTTALAASKRFALQAVEQANLNKLEAAERRADDARLVFADGPWADFATGAIAMARVDYPAAIKLFRKAAANLDGGQPEIKASLAEALALQGHLKDAESLLADLDSIDDWRIVMSAGRALYAAHKWDACQKPLSRAIELMNEEADRPRDNVLEAERLLDAAPAQKACEGFYEEIRQLPFDKMVERIGEKLKEIHQGKILFEFFGNLEDGIEFRAHHHWGFKHLYPLRNLPVTRLMLTQTSIWDLSPIEGMSLEYVNFYQSYNIPDLQPLVGTKTLKWLDLGRTNINDLSPLEGLQVKHLDLYKSQVTDLAPLAGMPLEHLNCNETDVADLTPLQGMPLEYLGIYRNATDLSPLQGMPLKEFHKFGPVRSFEPLRGMPLENFSWTFGGIPNSHDKRRAFLAPLAGAPLQEINLNQTGVRKLDFLRGSSLKILNLRGCADIESLEPLAGLPIEEINLVETWMTDWSPLETLEQVDHDRSPWVAYLLGNSSEQDLKEKLRLYSQRYNTSLSPIWKKPYGVTKSVLLFKLQKLYGEGRLEDAVAILEKHMAMGSTDGHLKMVLDDLQNRLAKQKKTESGNQ